MIGHIGQDFSYEKRLHLFDNAEHLYDNPELDKAQLRKTVLSNMSTKMAVISKLGKQI